MNERIKLTEDLFSYDEGSDVLDIEIVADMNITGKDFYDVIIKQILDDQEKAEKLDELIESKQVVYTGNEYAFDVIQENKQLKEDFEYWKKRIRDECNLVEGEEFSRLMGIHDESQLWLKNKEEFRNLKQKLKKIKSFEYNLRNTDDADLRPVLRLLRDILEKEVY